MYFKPHRILKHSVLVKCIFFFSESCVSSVSIYLWLNITNFYSLAAKLPCKNLHIKSINFSTIVDISTLIAMVANVFLDGALALTHPAAIW